MDYTFLMMRHAYSKHNLEKDQWKERYGDKSYKQLHQYRISKFSPDLIDSSSIDKDQCHEVAKSFIDFSSIKLIICSPLKRCLQTCKKITECQALDIPVFVEPLLSNRLSAAWSIGSTASSLAKDYPNFDFTAMEEISEDWMVRMLSHIDRFSYAEMLSKNLGMQEYLLKKVETGEGESYWQFFERIKKLRNRIMEIVSKLSSVQDNRKQILIISHSCVLSFLLGNQLNEKGKVKDKISFGHCIPLRFGSREILKRALDSGEK